MSVAVTHTLRALGRRFLVDALTVKSEELSHVERYHRARMLRVPVGGGPFPQQVEALRRAVARQLESDDYEAVHFRGVLEGAPAIARAKELGYRTILELSHFAAADVSHRAEEFGVHDAYCAALRAEEEECVRRADLVIAGSRVVRDALRAAGRRSQVEHLPQGVDVDRFDWNTQEPSRLPVVLYVGSLRADRGLEVLIEAAVEVLRYREVRFVLVGPGTPAQVKSLREQGRARRIDDFLEVRHAVAHDVLPDLYAQASVCVAPCADANLPRPHAPPPMSILEALACRRPVVATRVSRVEEVLSDGHDGLLVSPGDVEELAAAIEQLLEDRGLAARLAETGYRKVRDSFAASATRRRLGEVYRRLFGGRIVRGGEDEVTDAIELITSGHTGTMQAALGTPSGTTGFEATPIGLEGPTRIHATVPPLDELEAVTDEFRAPDGKQQGEAQGKRLAASTKREDTLPEIVLPEHSNGAEPGAAPRTPKAATHAPRAELAESETQPLQTVSIEAPVSPFGPVAKQEETEAEEPVSASVSVSKVEAKEGDRRRRTTDLTVETSEDDEEPAEREGDADPLPEVETSQVLLEEEISSNTKPLPAALLAPPPPASASAFSPMPQAPRAKPPPLPSPPGLRAREASPQEEPNEPLKEDEETGEKPAKPKRDTQEEEQPEEDPGTDEHPAPSS